ncbi:hypothetical protein ABT039_22810 [Streptomyces lasiicapitis]|uniref:hypothetical protein n=1 Tax=Streptomyces lasiicapitis TaxID=1923961 RepID=UPI00331E8D62
MAKTKVRTLKKVRKTLVKHPERMTSADYDSLWDADFVAAHCATPRSPRPRMWRPSWPLARRTGR